MWAARHFFALRMPWAPARIRRDDFAHLDQLYRRWAPSWTGADRDETLDAAKAAFRDDRALNGALDYYRALSAKAIPELDVRSPVPGLVVADTGDMDAGLFERSAELLGEGSKTLVFGRGHWPHREHEAAFTDGLLDFLRRV
jgi:pimeloyl-ACP methyl ester carboxylesterase